MRSVQHYLLHLYIYFFDGSVVIYSTVVIIIIIVIIIVIIKSSGGIAVRTPMWPGFDSHTRHHMWVEFVGSLLCSERFFPMYSNFPLSLKTNI